MTDKSLNTTNLSFSDGRQNINIHTGIRDAFFPLFTTLTKFANITTGKLLEKSPSNFEKLKINNKDWGMVLCLLSMHKRKQGKCAIKGAFLFFWRHDFSVYLWLS